MRETEGGSTNKGVRTCRVVGVVIVESGRRERAEERKRKDSSWC